MSGSCAVPLCLPNNCKWDAQTGEYSKNGDERKTLCVVDKALERLRNIKGTCNEVYTISDVMPKAQLCVLSVCVSVLGECASISTECITEFSPVDK